MSRTPKVLIVEDEQLLNEVYSMVLSMNGFTIANAFNGLEALDALPTFEPDIILLDLLMPQMDGLTFLEHFTKDKPAGTKVIVYSNLFDGKTVEQVRAFGVADIALKSSLTPNQLVELISSHL